MDGDLGKVMVMEHTWVRGRDKGCVWCGLTLVLLTKRFITTVYRNEKERLVSILCFCSIERFRHFTVSPYSYICIVSMLSRSCFVSGPDHCNTEEVCEVVVYHVLDIVRGGWWS